MEPDEDLIAIERPNSDKKHPFGKRFHAWWHGYALPPSEDHGRSVPTGGRDSTPNVPSANPEAEAAREVGEAASEGPAEASSSRPGTSKSDDGIRHSDTWPRERIEIAQRVWGDGFVVPGGMDHVLRLTRPLKISDSGGIMEIGPGTGAYGRLLAENFGASVASWKPDPALADMASAHARAHGCDNMVSTLELIPEDFQVKPEHFSVALVHECLYLIKGKENLLRNIIQSVRSTGEILIYDFFCDDNDGFAPLVEWMEAEPGEVYPMGIGAATGLLERLGMEITETEDESASYSAFALKEWGTFADNSEKFAPRKDLAMALVREVEYWTRLVGAIDSGALKVFRINGKRKGNLSW